MNKPSFHKAFKSMPTSGAIISDDLHYRYALWRVWNVRKPLLAVIMSNPSTANSSENDNTIEKVIKLATCHGYGGFIVGNLCAYRTPDPKELKGLGGEAFGKHNLQVINDMLKKTAPVVLCAWGSTAPKDVVDYALPKIEAMLERRKKKLHCLHINADGNPKHPLYCRDDQDFVEYTFPPRDE